MTGTGLPNTPPGQDPAPWRAALRALAPRLAVVLLLAAVVEAITSTAP
ncbi:hypothetical protein [Sinorhizobium sp. BG8]|nr:hypothetical protein [Sinorhizobium sp. BG8]